MKISEVPTFSKKHGFEFALSLFLESFYRHPNQQKYFLIQEEPSDETAGSENLCVLAASAHKLANDFHLKIPPWVFNSKYVMRFPVYPFGMTEENTEQTILEMYAEDTPDEFKIRNLYCGARVLRKA